MSCEHARDDGAYVLGALSPAERETFERHLAACRTCRNAVGELAALPGLLARLDVETAERVALAADASEASRLPRLLRAAEETRRWDRRRRRWRAVGATLAAACLAAIVGIGVAVVADPEPAGPPPPVTMQPMVPVSGTAGPVTAQVGLADEHGGTRVWMHCWYESANDYHKPWTFRLVARGTDGTKEQVGSWEAGPGDDLAFTGFTRFAMNKLDRLELVRWDDVPVLVYTVA